MLKAWSALAESGCVPLPLWPQLVQSAAGRLEDSSVMVVKVWGGEGGGPLAPAGAECSWPSGGQQRHGGQGVCEGGGGDVCM